MITSLAFIVYPVSDIAAARRFYEGILGLRLTHQVGGELRALTLIDGEAIRINEGMDFSL